MDAASLRAAAAANANADDVRKRLLLYAQQPAHASWPLVAAPVAPQPLHQIQMGHAAHLTAHAANVAAAAQQWHAWQLWQHHQQQQAQQLQVHHQHMAAASLVPTPLYSGYTNVVAAEPILVGVDPATTTAAAANAAAASTTTTTTTTNYAPPSKRVSGVGSLATRRKIVTVSNSKLGGGGGGSTTIVVNTGRWTSAENEVFLSAQKAHGRDWQRISRIVGSRTSAQCRAHGHKLELTKKRRAERAAVAGADDLGEGDVPTAAANKRGNHNVESDNASDASDTSDSEASGGEHCSVKGRRGGHCDRGDVVVAEDGGDETSECASTSLCRTSCGR